MTAPVSQRAGADGEWVIRFFMPADKTIESLPEPDDDAIKLVTVPAETVAVRRFTGSRSRRAIASQTAELTRALRVYVTKALSRWPGRVVLRSAVDDSDVAAKRGCRTGQAQPVRRGSMCGFLR